MGKSEAYLSVKSQSAHAIDDLNKEAGCWGIFCAEHRSYDISTFKKYLISLKYNSLGGTYWDILQVVLSLLACAIYVAESYRDSYLWLQIYSIIENIITQFFLMDFIVSWFIASSTIAFFKSPMAWIDIVTIIPVYLTYIQQAPNISWLRFARILRLIRILRTFRLLGGFSGVKRQIITLILALLSLTFLAAGVINLTENDVNELSYDCQYINEKTGYEPSCDSNFSSFDDPTCDCRENNCYALHDVQDTQYKPSKIRCRSLAFFECLYFVVVTISVVGYGDFNPTNNASRIATLMLIIAALIVIPMQINKLQTLLSMNSPFRTTYEARPHENHLILCGHVNDKSKLSRVFREFFHPDRYATNTPEFHLVILSPAEPVDEVKDLIHSPLFDSRVSYIIGSALNMEDLQKARADIASGMLFLSNVEVDEEDALLDDAATVLRTLSVNNFNARLECLVQVLRSQDRDLLKDSDADLVLCLDEYKTTLQCRNAICPGLATLVENLFHSFSSTCGKYAAQKVGDNWLSEYTYGVGMELYYVPIDHNFFQMLGFSWSLLVEAIYIEFECTFVGVYSSEDQGFYYNPRQYERKKFKSVSAFFEKFNVGVLLAPNNAVASAIGYSMTDSVLVDRMLQNMISAEQQFAVRRHRNIDSIGSAPVVHTASTSSSHMKDIVHLEKAQNLIDSDFAIVRKRDTVFNQVADNGVFGFDTDSSEENDDDFLGYIEHPIDPVGFSCKNVVSVDKPSSTIKVDSIRGDFMRKFSIDDDQSQPTTVKSELSLESQSPPVKLQLDRDLDDAADCFVSVNDETLDLLDDNNSPQLRDMRDIPSVSKKALLQMKSSSGKMTNMKSMKNMISKKNKLKSLKQAAALVRTVNAQTTGVDGAKGKFAMVARKAVQQSTIGALNSPSIAATTKPASIVAALQQTRLNSMSKRKGKRSVKDVAMLARMAALKTESAMSPSPTKDLSTPVEQPSGEVISSVDLSSQNPSIASLVSKFKADKEEKRKLRRVLSTRTSSIHDEDNKRGESVKKSTSRKFGRSESGAGEIIQSTAAQSGPSGSGIARRVAAVMRTAPVLANQSRRGSLDAALPQFSNDSVQKSVPRFGAPSEEIYDAADLKGHIIFFGCMDHILLLVSELRKPLVVDDAYHPILIVNPGEPRKWHQIQSRYDDVYFLDSNVSSNQELTLMNVRAAYALVLLASRERINVDETSNVDSDAIFKYLKVERFVPRDVFFTVELSCPNNMGVLNSAIVRRSKLERDVTSRGPLWGDTGTGLASCLKGNYKFRNSIDVDVLLGHMKTEAVLDQHKECIQLTAGKFSRRRQSAAMRRLSVGPQQNSSGQKSKTSMVRSHTPVVSTKKEQKKTQNGNYWDVDDSHHVLPIFAAGRAIVPSSFDSMLCQSFFGTITPQLCEKLVCGQDMQMLLHVTVPNTFFGRKYGDLFRALNSRCLLPLALYRTPLPRNEAILPYVFTNPPVDTIVNGDDRILVYGNPETVQQVVKKLELPLLRRNGKMALGEDISASISKPKRIIKTSTAGTYTPLGTTKQPVVDDCKDMVSEVSVLPSSFKPKVKGYVPVGASRVHPESQWVQAGSEMISEQRRKGIDDNMHFPDPVSFRDGA
eukprot:CAMPEP_0185030594 /NCGR_PEP_ID=MMETSP1103-20130426/17565_1 /TAXON_ID=36769 /ORGANISM="Paraphysomonas bandaiensis, Strain Caron Lab Isolate" /LENGTH=1609 /DNA_ID=CAMNT_0027565787 /DNA_START=240 /DNA_END=5069 /DNA_ORIENTATION=+